MGAKGEEGKKVMTLAKIAIPHLPLHALRLSPPSRTLFSEHSRLELAKQRFTGEDPCWKTLKTSARDTCKRSLLPLSICNDLRGMTNSPETTSVPEHREWDQTLTFMVCGQSTLPYFIRECNHSRSVPRCVKTRRGGHLSLL